MLSNPELLAEGTAIAVLEQPDRVLIGGVCQAPGVAQFSMSGVAQFSVSLDTPGSGEGGLHLVADANQAASGADAMLLLTEWPQFAALDWAELAPL